MVVVLDLQRAQVLMLVEAAALQVLVDGQLAHRLGKVQPFLRAHPRCMSRRQNPPFFVHPVQRMGSLRGWQDFCASAPNA